MPLRRQSLDKLNTVTEHAVNRELAFRQHLLKYGHTVVQVGVFIVKQCSWNFLVGAYRHLVNWQWNSRLNHETLYSLCYDHNNTIQKTFHQVRQMLVIKWSVGWQMLGPYKNHTIFVLHTHTRSNLKFVGRTLVMYLFFK